MVFLKIILFLVCLFSFIHCSAKNPSVRNNLILSDFNSNLSSAILAGGCFWCTESDLEKFPHVTEAISGYTGGSKLNPTYREVSTGQTQHLESVQIFFDSTKVTYRQIIQFFFKTIDPTDNKGQFADRGHHYTTAIFYLNPHQQKVALEEKKRLQESKKFFKNIYTVIRPAQKFYTAEEYHQNYYKKNPIHYQSYRFYSGRISFIKKHWGNIYLFKKNIP